MSTCKFFLQGICKYGDNCKFSHQINDTTQTHGASIMRQNSKPQQIDTNLLIKSVVNDMTNAEKGAHWLLSSYAPFKDKPCFPGFENRSFEEVRWGYYEASKNGTLEQYKQQLQLALQDAAMKMKTLQNPSSEIISMLIHIYNSSVNSSGQFNSTPTSPIFPQNQPTFNQNQPQGASIFALANQELFGKTSPNQQQSMFASSPTNSNLFSNTTPANTNQNIFSGNQLLFNKPQGFSNANNSMFANQNFTPTTQSNPFAGQSNTFTAQNSMFSPPPANAFNTNPNIFKVQPQPSLFQNQPSSNALFKSQTLSTDLQPSASLFQNQAPSNKLFISPNQSPNNPVFSPPNPSSINNPIFSPPNQSTINPVFSPPNQSTINNPIFSPPNQSAINNPIFSPPNQSTSNNPVFSSPNQLTSNNPIFSSPNQSANNNPIFSPLSQSFSFAKAAAANIQPTPFSQPPQASNIFTNNSLQQQNTSPFQQQQPVNNPGSSIFNVATNVNPNIFGGQSPLVSNQLVNTQQTSPTAVFNQAVPVNNGFGSKTEVIDSNAYSKLEDLSESDIKSFQSECFEFGKIPEKPPTAQMCN